MGYQFRTMKTKLHSPCSHHTTIMGMARYNVAGSNTILTFNAPDCSSVTKAVSTVISSTCPGIELEYVLHLVRIYGMLRSFTRHGSRGKWDENYDNNAEVGYGCAQMTAR